MLLAGFLLLEYLLNLVWFFNLTQNPINFIKRQVKLKGNIFTIDTVLRESVFVTNNIHIESNDLLYLGDQMGDIFQKEYKIKMFWFMNLANETFGNVDFFKQNQKGLEEYLKNNLKMENVDDIFEICSAFYLHSLLYLCLGERVFLENGFEIIQSFHQAQGCMNFSILKLIGSYGFPIGPSNTLNKFAILIKNIINKEIDAR